MIVLRNYQERRNSLLVVLAGLSVMSLIVSNLLAAKLFNFFGIPVDCGILLYPVSYIVGDLTVHYFGKKTADFVVNTSAVIATVTALLLKIATYLPPYPGWDLQDSYASIFHFTLRITCASIIAYILSGIANNHVFERLRRKGFARSALGSSAVAHLVDSAIFEVYAFIGVLPLADFLRQATFAYLASFVIEAILFIFLTRPIKDTIDTWFRK